MDSFNPNTPKDVLSNSENISPSTPDNPTVEVPSVESQIIPLPNNFLKHLSKHSKDKKGLQPNIFGHFLITGSLVFAIFLLWSVLSWFAGTKEKEWLVQPEKVPTPVFAATVQSKPEIKARLNEQFTEIQTQIESHKNVMVYFYKQSYICGSMSLSLAIVSGLCIFFISRDGWEKANNGLINAFLVTSSAAFVYNQLPVIFKQDANIEGNRTSYLEYITLRNEFLSYASTGGTIGSDATQPNVFALVDPNQFIHQVDQRMAKLNQIAIDFDLSRVTDSPDFLENLRATSKSQPKNPVALPKSSPTPTPSK